MSAIHMHPKETASGGAPVSILDADPDLGSSIAEGEWEIARELCRGRLVERPAGVWEVPRRVGPSGAILGWLIVRGVVCREFRLGERHMLELLPPGDVLAPPAGDDRPALGGGIVLTTGEGTILVELGERFLRAGARWPGLLAEVSRRLEVQREHLAIQGLIAHLPRAEHRLLMVLWHLAERWGRVTVDGTVLPLPLTHDLLGQLAAARRSTVSLAAAALEAEGYTRRLDDGSWLLTPAAEKKVDVIVAAGVSERVLGESFLLRQRASHARSEAHALRAEAAQARRRAAKARAELGNPA